MPIITLTRNVNYDLILWKIEEEFHTLIGMLNPTKLEKKELLKINHLHRKKQNIVARIMLNYLAKQKISLKYLDSGKPYCDKYKHISISHSKNYCILTTSKKIIGADIQYKKENIAKLSTKFINKYDSKYLNRDKLITNLHFIWCAKEAIYKTIIQRHCSLYKDIYIERISNYFGAGNYIKNNIISRYNINFETLDNYFIAIAQKND